MPLPRSTLPRGEGKCPYPGALSRGERGNALTPEYFPEGRGEMPLPRSTFPRGEVEKI